MFPSAHQHKMKLANLYEMADSESTELAKDYISMDLTDGPLPDVKFEIRPEKVIVYHDGEEYHVIKAEVPSFVWLNFLRVVRKNDNL